MPVYSANRMGSIGGSNYINENYSAPCDLSRVMAETVEGDLNLFEAIVCSDIAEATAIREGYLTESDDEIAENGKKAGNAILNFLKSIWDKICSIFRGIGERIKAIWNKIFGSKDKEAAADKVLEEARTDPEIKEKVDKVLSTALVGNAVTKESIDNKINEFKERCSRTADGFRQNMSAYTNNSDLNKLDPNSNRNNVSNHQINQLKI